MTKVSYAVTPRNTLFYDAVKQLSAKEKCNAFYLLDSAGKNPVAAVISTTLYDTLTRESHVNPLQVNLRLKSVPQPIKRVQFSDNDQDLITLVREDGKAVPLCLDDQRSFPMAYALPVSQFKLLWAAQSYYCREGVLDRLQTAVSKIDKDAGSLLDSEFLASTRKPQAPRVHELQS